MNNELYHHGIKGQRWGIRRFQKPDGSLTSQGKKKYASNSTGESSPKKSKHRQWLEERYRSLGMNEEEVQTMVDKRIKTEKVLAVSAGIAVTACAAYYAHSVHKDKIDKVIKAGKELQRIEMQDTNGELHDVFYAAGGKHDTQRYYNMLGSARQQKTGKAYLMQLQNTKDIKVASKDNAAKIFKDLYKNDEQFRDAVKPHVKDFVLRNNVDNIDNLSNKNIKKMYENFNANLIYVRESGSGADKKFYDKLKSSGYGAIQDINDMKFSGYHAKNPLIIFDNSDKKIMVKSAKEITENLEGKYSTEYAKAIAESVSEERVKNFINTQGVGAATTLSIAAIGTYTTDPAEYAEKAKK